MRINILIGGKAGQGSNILALLVGEALVKQGYYAFASRDYESLIRGGHNFNVLTFSDKKVGSNDSKIDILVCLDEHTEKIHKKNLRKNGIVLDGKHENMFFAGCLFKILGLDFKLLENELKNLRNFEENLKEAKKGFNTENKDKLLPLGNIHPRVSQADVRLFFVSQSPNKPPTLVGGKTQGLCDIEKRKVEITKPSREKGFFINGTQGISQGAIESGLDVYYAYPMTPATPLLSELAARQIKNNILVLELENEISVINAALGSSLTGAKSMIGTSGGGFDLMTEALSMAGQAEIPIVCYLSARPGPSTGVATYTSQGDLQFARHCGHGEFFRLVVAAGDPKEATELISQCFYFSQKYKIPTILLGDKHLAESFYTQIDKARITKSKKTTKLGRYNSYEHTKSGEATEDAEIIKENFEARMEKQRNIIRETEKFRMFKIHGNKNSKNLIIGWGSVKGAILDAIEEIDAKFLQILYIEPFPDIKSELEKAKSIILVENDASGMIADVIMEKTGILISEKNKILRYDGRPFLADELKKEIEKRI